MATRPIPQGLQQRTAAINTRAMGKGPLPTSTRTRTIDQGIDLALGLVLERHDGLDEESTVVVVLLEALWILRDNKLAHLGVPVLGVLGFQQQQRPPRQLQRPPRRDAEDGDEMQARMGLACGRALGGKESNGCPTPRAREQRRATRATAGKTSLEKSGKLSLAYPVPSDNYTLNLRIAHSFSRSLVSMTSTSTSTNLTTASVVFDRTKLARSLLRAVHRGDVARVRELLHERGAPVDARDELNHNVTPLHVACRLGNADCVRLLVEYGAHVHAFDDRRYPPLYYAVQQLHREAAGVLVRECRADVDLRCGPDRRPLLHQVHGSVAQAEMLLRLGANVNALCDCGQTALFPAAFRGHEELVCLLIDHKADVSIAATMLDFPLSEEQRNERRVRVTRAPQPTGGSSRSRKLNSTTVFVCVCFGLQVYPLGTAADAALTPAIRNIIQTRGASRATTSQLNSVPTLNLTGEQSRHDTNGASPSTTELLASFGLSLGHWCRFTRSSAKTRFSERCQSSSCSRYLQHYARNE